MGFTKKTASSYLRVKWRGDILSYNSVSDMSGVTYFKMLFNGEECEPIIMRGLINLNKDPNNQTSVRHGKPMASESNHNNYFSFKVSQKLCTSDHIFKPSLVL